MRPGAHTELVLRIPLFFEPRYVFIPNPTSNDASSQHGSRLSLTKNYFCTSGTPFQVSAVPSALLESGRAEPLSP